MRVTYGNRVPPVFRWSVAVLILVPLAALVGSSFAGFVDEPAPVVVLTAIGVIVVCVYWRAGTLVRADPDAVRVSLPPFWTRRIPLATIRSVEVESIAHIGREWGIRGSLRSHGEVFVDAGESRTCLAFYLGDGRVIRLGVSSPERGSDIADRLGRLLDEFRGRTQA